MKLYQLLTVGVLTGAMGLAGAANAQTPASGDTVFAETVKDVLVNKVRKSQGDYLKALFYTYFRTSPLSLGHPGHRDMGVSTRDTPPIEVIVLYCFDMKKPCPWGVS